MKTERIGIYGGTFSPPHIGHVRAAEVFLSEMSLDKLLVIPTFEPPHKDFHNEASTAERLEMCRLAFSDIPNCEISDLEILRGGKSYTYLTLEALMGEGRELYMLVGTDMMLTLDEWKNPERIFAAASICYVRRETDPESKRRLDEKIRLYESRFGARIYAISNKVIEISSSELRAAIANGKKLGDYLSGSVKEYIADRGLYR
ncbi:MAG: nicotinate (nicotinamide) nucleotide adenylyltransferase [Ruminococcaceae bacterium]|nr:nicotinate (nicotinamide) nucleotide adenylyltransferase [Oscillospiraceae bacterium]